MYLYVWEDNRPETFDILLNGVLMADNYNSGSAGAWKRLGPWPARSTDGRLVVEGYGGNANFSGIEIWYANADALPYRAISLNGPATRIDGVAWEGADAPNLSVEGSRFCNQSVSLVPPTDAERAAMLRCSIWS